MTVIDIYSGFLGAGKTTLIKKMISEAFAGQKLALIENEFGEIGIDGGFLREAGIEITEMNSGCICCSLVGDFGDALRKLISEYHPERILIEPTGVGKLSDVIAAARQVESEDVQLGCFTTVADAKKVKLYMKNFGEFYNNQIETASCIVLSRTDSITQDKLDDAVTLLREHNSRATIVTTPWDQLTGAQLLSAMEQTYTLAKELSELEAATHHEHHHHNHEDEEAHEHHHHHHDHDHHHHGHDHHHHGHDHDADEVFMSWGVETAKKFTKEAIEQALKALDSTEDYGIVLRAKGIVAAEDSTWLHFDHVPGEIDVREGSAEVTGRLCVIGSQLNEPALHALFDV